MTYYSLFALVIPIPIAVDILATAENESDHYACAAALTQPSTQHSALLRSEARYGGLPLPRAASGRIY